MKKNSKLVRLFLGFLFVINALGHSSAIDILGDQIEKQKELDEATRISFTSAKKETADGREAHKYHVRKLGFGRKKSKVIHNNKESNMVKEEKGSSSEGGGRRTTARKISGATYSDGICDFEREGSINVKCKVDHNKTEDDDTLNKSMVLLRERDDQKKDDYQSIARNLPKYSQISEEEPQAHEDEGNNTQKDEEEKVKRGSEEEVMDFIHMDYEGKAHRKPPINNDEPRN